MEKTKQCRLEDNRDDEFTDISFEELLAQEKKDSFWLVLFHFSQVCKFKGSSSLFSILKERVGLQIVNNKFFCICCTGKEMGNQESAQANKSSIQLTI